MTSLIKRMSSLGRVALALVFAIGLAVLSSHTQPAHANGVALTAGDVLASTGNGNFNHFSNTGSLLDVLNDGTASRYTTGGCFDAVGNFRGTNFSTGNVSLFDKNGNLVNGTWATGMAQPESCTVDRNGNVWVGDAGSKVIREFSAAGALVNSFTVAIQDRGTDWIDLAADQCTMLYTSEGNSIFSFNVCTNTQNSTFATVPSFTCYATRIRPNGEVMVACSDKIYRLSGTGSIIQTYSLGAGALFSLNLDPDNTSFWTGDFNNNTIYRVAIDSGAILASFSSQPQVQLFGLTVVGEITVALDTTPPSCGIDHVVVGPPKQLIIAVQDSDGGLAAPPNGIVVTSTTNATVALPTYSAGEKGIVFVTATKVDQTLGSTVALRVTDTAGNVTNCDPAILDLGRSTGKPASTVAHGIAKSEHLVHIYNGTPGVSTLTVDVNGKHFQVSNLSAGQKATIDIASALGTGANSVTLTATGQPGGSVIAVVGDR